ncbi:dnaJ homolog subfamily C member 30, mitochondrial-like [Physella acuta]|uniref:dnaJ homolog subfamily C member 30, mitochondrial-like n=1 Tax=Physella acuta TaxID=109671 RepID=UPI0027DC5E8B|nr:dnaJ homolog subfamily C member 30, mitochondrial-like [Physella acuta]
MNKMNQVLQLQLLGPKGVVSNIYRLSSTASKSAFHYYDILGLKPSATQNQIKSAYYEKSKKYHPDTAQCVLDHSHFTEINEAYEVLGNIRKRRMYDRGVYNHGHMSSERSSPEAEEDYTQAFRNASQQQKRRPKAPRGHTKIYNFDDFYRQHYNVNRERKAAEFKAYQNYMEMKLKAEQEQNEFPVSSLIILCALSLCSFVIWYKYKDAKDIVHVSSKKNDRSDL